MIVTRCLLREARSEITFQPSPVVIFQDQAGGKRQRLVINHPRRMVMSHPFTLVGFFGQKKVEEDLLPLRNELDQALVTKFPNHPDLLSYSTLELLSGNFCNLVLFSRPEAKAHWRSSQTHARVVRELAPRYYASIRLNLEAVAKAPSAITLHARNPDHNLQIGRNYLNFATIASAPFYNDLSIGRREGRLEDYRGMAHLAQVCNPIHLVEGQLVEPQGVPTVLCILKVFFQESESCHERTKPASTA